MQAQLSRCTIRIAATTILALCGFLPAVGAQVPVYEVTPVESSIQFDVESSVPIKGTFGKWDASLTFASSDVRSGVLDIKIQADSVDTGSGIKNGKLKGKDFLRCEGVPDDYLQIHQGRPNRTKHV